METTDTTDATKTIFKRYLEMRVSQRTMAEDENQYLKMSAAKKAAARKLTIETLERLAKIKPICQILAL